MLAMGGIFSKLEELELRMGAVRALRILSRLMSYREISRYTGLPPSTISRYITGKILPSLRQAWSILSSFLEVHDLIITSDKGGFVVKSPSYIELAVLLGKLALRVYSGTMFDAVTAVGVYTCVAKRLAEDLGLRFISLSTPPLILEKPDICILPRSNIFGVVFCVKRSEIKGVKEALIVADPLVRRMYSGFVEAAVLALRDLNIGAAILDYGCREGGETRATSLSARSVCVPRLARRAAMTAVLNTEEKL